MIRSTFGLAALAARRVPPNAAGVASIPLRGAPLNITLPAAFGPEPTPLHFNDMGVFPAAHDDPGLPAEPAAAAKKQDGITMAVEGLSAVLVRAEPETLLRAAGTGRYSGGQVRKMRWDREESRRKKARDEAQRKKNFPRAVRKKKNEVE